MTKAKTDKKVTSDTETNSLTLADKPTEIKSDNVQDAFDAKEVKESKEKEKDREKNKTKDPNRSTKKTIAKEKNNKFNIASLNLTHLQMYRKVHKLANVKMRSSRDELVKAATEHFDNQVVDEAEIIANFVYHVNKRKSEIYTILKDN